ncbi:MAG: hypothetical protein KIT09_27295 [Bryobacteraceae bacterium]|nr:hypothetical protein [Bryobacteraceae bacterium]
MLESGGIDCLKNEARVIQARGQFLHIASVGDLWTTEVGAEQLAQQAESLRQVNEDLRQFADAASHDMQEPLRMVIAYSQLLHRKQQQAGKEGMGEITDYLLEGGFRMQELINGLLAYSRAIQETARGACRRRMRRRQRGALGSGQRRRHSARLPENRLRHV